ncbi:MAG: AMP-binding protein [Deltaproteobacteria bacterium]|nr:AMP-binding protein [Candidatus Zymogenaceae bacterium]
MRLFNRRYETLSRDDMAQLQLERLQSTINRAYKNVVFYQSEMKDRDISPRDITQVADLTKIGFTTRDDLSYNYPYGLFAVPLRDIVRINSTSGITGKPTVIGYTKNDLGVWTELISRLFTGAGVTADDIVQMSFDFGMANWGRSMRAAAEHIEASVIPMSYLNASKELMIMSDYRTSCLVSTPSHALHLAWLAKEQGMDVAKLNISRAILVSEPLSDVDRERIESGLGVHVSTAYGIPEGMGPGVAYECAEGRLHISEDHFIVETIHPETSEPVPAGEEGELVITTITTKAFPLIRFRTGDISRIVPDGECPCGRTLSVMEAPMKRSDDMLSFRGIKVYPNQIKSVISGVLGESPPFVIELFKVKELDHMDIYIEEGEALFSDTIKQLENIISGIRGDLLELLGIRANIKLVESSTMQELLERGKQVIYRDTISKE